MKNSYEKTVFSKQDNLKVQHKSVNLEKTVEYLKTHESSGLKIFQSIIYVKEYFYMLFFTLKDIIQAQTKKTLS